MTKEELAQFKARLKSAIYAAGYTQTTLAAALGICNGTMTYKMKTCTFTLAEAVEMMRILNVKDPAYIFLGYDAN